MRAVRLTGAAGELSLGAVPEPVPGRNEVLVKVCAAGVTPTELQWYPTTHNRDGSARSGAIPGHEFSGVIAKCGEGVEDFAAGDEVFGMNDWFADGATAEYCFAPAESVARKPEKLSHAEAAAVPIGALTAWQGLLERAGIRTGERVLVHGGAGAVGLFVVQLAKLHGADVVATASAGNLAFLSELGASQTIDYAAGPFEQKVRDVDVVFDCVGGETLARSWIVLRSGGRMVTVASDSEGTDDARVKEAFFIVEPNRRQLAEIGALLDAGSLRVFVDNEVPLADAPAAYLRRVNRKHGHGKVVVVIDESCNKERRGR